MHPPRYQDKIHSIQEWPCLSLPFAFGEGDLQVRVCLGSGGEISRHYVESRIRKTMVVAQLWMLLIMESLYVGFCKWDYILPFQKPCDSHAQFPGR